MRVLASVFLLGSVILVQNTFADIGLVSYKQETAYVIYAEADSFQWKQCREATLPLKRDCVSDEPTVTVDPKAFYLDLARAFGIPNTPLDKGQLEQIDKRIKLIDQVIAGGTLSAEEAVKAKKEKEALKNQALALTRILDHLPYFQAGKEKVFYSFQADYPAFFSLLTMTGMEPESGVIFKNIGRHTWEGAREGCKALGKGWSLPGIKTEDNATKIIQFILDSPFAESLVPVEIGKDKRKALSMWSSYHNVSDTYKNYAAYWFRYLDDETPITPFTGSPPYKNVELTEKSGRMNSLCFYGLTGL